MTTGTATATATATMIPSRYRVVDRHRETVDTVTLGLDPVDTPLRAFRPGQFAMLYAFGIGEVPISVSGRRGVGGLVHTIRAVGTVTTALASLAPGQVVGVRGPLGRGWTLPGPSESDIVIVAGGLGLAPLRPVIHQIGRRRARYRSVHVLIGARTPTDLLFTDEYPLWEAAGLRLHVTVDRPVSDWRGHVGVVTTPLGRLDIDPTGAVAFVCGPEVMMRFAARALLRRGLSPERIGLSLERSMVCGVSRCGHCQLGPLLLCRDGPVVGYDVAEPLLAVREL